MTGFGRTRWLAIALIATASTFLHLPLKAVDYQRCYRCHEGALVEDIGREFLHVPFREQQCGRCHEAGSVLPAPEKARAARPDERLRIEWLGETTVPDTSHAFLLPDEKVRDSLLVEVRGKGGASFRQEVAVPRLSDLPAVRDPGKAPSISGLRVLDVERGLFLSASIAWQTDTIADAVIRYGKDDLKLASPKSPRLGRRHHVILYDLEPGKTYRFSATSEDLFGRRQSSEVLTFSTAKPVTTSAPGSGAVGAQPLGKEPAVGSRFQRVGADYLLELTLEQPAAVSVGTRGAARKQNPAQTSTAATGQADSHSGLSGKLARSVPVCEKCHQQHGVATHPVNVYPKPGMTIPPEYKLLDGRITCVTCHESHGSNHEFLSIKARQKELCIGCHRNMR